jgi:hypothetical protein
MISIIETLFPRLRGSGYRVTSPANDVYNCIAWAAGVTDAWWWPGDPQRSYWPPTVPRERTLEAFRQLFAALGYEQCAGDELEPGFAKIAIFADVLGQPAHAARQLTTGGWTSRLGASEDIEHALGDVAGDVYGSIVLIMRRALI